MLLTTPAFTYPALQKIALYRSLEGFFGNRDHHTVKFSILSTKAKIPHARHIAVLSFGKKLGDGRLAAQSFFFRKSIRSVSVHDVILKDKLREL